MRINGSTLLIGIIGHPLGHSLSPAMHNAAFEALGLDMAYVPLPVDPGAIAPAVRGLAALGFRGANVTVPHKGAVVPFMSWLSDDARLVEAVNTIVVAENGALHGYNTDVEGARLALLQAVDGEGLAAEEALLLGAGGAARAVALALARLGMRLTIVNRTDEAGRRLVELIRAAAPTAACRHLLFSELSPAVVASQRLVVNATTLGMSGAGKVPAPLVDTVTAGQIVFDVVYRDGGTDLLAAARERGATAVDGVAMLVGQAAAAFELWTGRTAPIEVMRAAVGRP